MPKTNKNNNEKKRNGEKNKSKSRKPTRRIEKGKSIPTFLIDMDYCLSCYNIRAVLSDKDDNLKKEFK